MYNIINENKKGFNVFINLKYLFFYNCFTHIKYLEYKYYSIFYSLLLIFD